MKNKFYPLIILLCIFCTNVQSEVHNVYSGDQSVILSTNIRFVRIDENNDPIPISDKVKKQYAI